MQFYIQVDEVWHYVRQKSQTFRIFISLIQKLKIP